MKSADNLQTSDTQISREDQIKINLFSRTNQKYNELQFDIKKLKHELENLQDAEGAVEEAMGDPLKLFIGEALIEVDDEAAQGYVEKVMEEKQEELEKLQDRSDEYETELKNLKSFLYARFGSNINLEENK